MRGDYDYAFFESIYMCNSTYDCYNKYVCGIIAIIFVILFATAVANFRKSK